MDELTDSVFVLSTSTLLEVITVYRHKLQVEVRIHGHFTDLTVQVVVRYSALLFTDQHTSYREQWVMDKAHRFCLEKRQLREGI